MRLEIYARLAMIPLGLTVAASGCTTASRMADSQSAAAQSLTATPAAVVAAYRYLIDNNASALQGQAASYCVGLGAVNGLTDPSAEVMHELIATQPKAKPASACMIGDRVVDSDGRPALVVNLRVIQCRAKDECVIDGGYYEGNLSGSGGHYRVRWVGQGWQVRPEGPQAIS